MSKRNGTAITSAILNADAVAAMIADAVKASQQEADAILTAAVAAAKAEAKAEADAMLAAAGRTRTADGKALLPDSSTLGSLSAMRKAGEAAEDIGRRLLEPEHKAKMLDGYRKFRKGATADICEWWHILKTRNIFTLEIGGKHKDWISFVRATCDTPEGGWTLYLAEAERDAIDYLIRKHRKLLVNLEAERLEAERLAAVAAGDTAAADAAAAAENKAEVNVSADARARFDKYVTKNYGTMTLVDQYAVLQGLEKTYNGNLAARKAADAKAEAARSTEALAPAA